MTIQVQDLTVSYGPFALRGVNLELGDGGCLAILGPSGAGKTLLLEAVMGARLPDRGCVLLDGANITTLPPEARRIAYIPQDLALFPHLSVLENIVFGLATRAERRNASKAVERLATLMEIEHLLDRPRVNTLSGGEKQRVALARAVLTQPRVLFLDEPFSSLDAASSANLLRAFRAMRRELNTTVFLVTHNLEEACFLADEVAIMMGGRIVESGPIEEVTQRPKSLEAIRFLNFRNIIRLSETPEEVRRRLPDPPPGSTHWAIQPEDIRVVQPGGDSDAVLKARALDWISAGRHSIVELHLDCGLKLEAWTATSGATGMTPRLRVPAEVGVMLEKIHFLTDSTASDLRSR